MIIPWQVMHDPVDIRRRIERVVARVDRRDDYGQLLARNQVIQDLNDVEDIDAWRADTEIVVSFSETGSPGSEAYDIWRTDPPGGC